MEELLMMRIMYLEAGLPQLIWVAVYGTAAFFSFRQGRKSDLDFRTLTLSLPGISIRVYVFACVFMLLVLMLQYWAIGRVDRMVMWKWSLQQAFLFLIYQIRVLYVFLLEKQVDIRRVIRIGAVLYGVGCLLLLVQPYGDWLALLIGAVFQLEISFRMMKRFQKEKSGKSGVSPLPWSMMDAQPVVLRFRPEDFDAESIPGRLLRLFRDEKVYLRPNLTLDEVAIELGTNKTYLSKCINIELQVNFREFVNAYRVQEAIWMYESDSNISLEELYRRSGFKNQASFTFSFKLNTGQTPGEWCKDVKQRKINEIK